MIHLTKWGEMSNPIQFSNELIRYFNTKNSIIPNTVWELRDNIRDVIENNNTDPKIYTRNRKICAVAAVAGSIAAPITALFWYHIAFIIGIEALPVLGVLGVIFIPWVILPGIIIGVVCAADIAMNSLESRQRRAINQLKNYIATPSNLVNETLVTLYNHFAFRKDELVNPPRIPGANHIRTNTLLTVAKCDAYMAELTAMQNNLAEFCNN